MSVFLDYSNRLYTSCKFSTVNKFICTWGYVGAPAQQTTYMRSSSRLEWALKAQTLKTLRRAWHSEGDGVESLISQKQLQNIGTNAGPALSNPSLVSEMSRRYLRVWRGQQLPLRIQGGHKHWTLTLGRWHCRTMMSTARVHHHHP